ncbi:transcriptional regulator NarL [Octadecabacter ascidiaceicola]|uniref:Transcriptional regulator NarL n=2 Tax=Octadecabacter ascidiaceicola TaxID=1655543 RepID=A0A238K333_9RHOB|nr:transcriptional regulator NarL [Octadecabacter ascidiaceicola]
MQNKPVITTETLTKWQYVVDQISEIAEVPATLIMHAHDQKNNVFVKSTGNENPYVEGQSFQLHDKLYCFGVLENDAELCVEDATCDPHWYDNPDMEYGMSFYVGLPLKWPDGSIFGTICMLDRFRNKRALSFRNGLRQFCRIVEDDLAMLEEIEHRKKAETRLQQELDAREAIINKRTRDLEDANTALRVLLMGVEISKNEVEERIVQQIRGLVLPHVGRLQQLVADDNRALSHLDIVEMNLKNITSDFTGKLAQAMEGLTPTEAEIVQLIVQGRSTKEIAKTLSRGTSTVDFHRNNIRQKLGLTHRGKNLRQHLTTLV